MSQRGLSGREMAVKGHNLGTPVSVVQVTCLGAATTALFANMPYRIQIIKAWGVMLAAGTANDTVKIQKVFRGTTSVITEVASIELLTDKEVFDFEELNDANWSVPLEAALQVVTAGGPATNHVEVFALYVRAEAA